MKIFFSFSGKYIQICKYKWNLIILNFWKQPRILIPWKTDWISNHKRKTEFCPLFYEIIITFMNVSKLLHQFTWFWNLHDKKLKYTWCLFANKRFTSRTTFSQIEKIENFFIITIQCRISDTFFFWLEITFKFVHFIFICLQKIRA